MALFSDFPLREELLRAIDDLGFSTPTSIQEKILPLLLTEPQDIIGLAQTGTGKTAAFGLPVLHHVDEKVPQVQALILSPTRELCMQIGEELGKYSKEMRGIGIVPVYGGVPIGGQIRELKRLPHVLVATPGRLIDLLERKAVSLEHVKYVVLDEADEMLNMGFRDDIEFILQGATSREHTWLFSATMSNEVRGIAKRFMKGWKEISAAPANTTHASIDHQYYVTAHHNRFAALQRLLDHTPNIYGIVFTRTRLDAQEVSDKLNAIGYGAAALHGDMEQKQRTYVMDRFRQRQIDIIVATDVAARGIDVADITHVINYEIPDDPEVYTHRSGRTGRAGKSGICMSLVSPREVGGIRGIERVVKARFVKADIPDGAEIVRKKLFHFLEEIETASPQPGFAEVYAKAMHDRFAELEKEEIIRRLVWLQVKETAAQYQNAEDLNAGYGGGRGEIGRSGPVTGPGGGKFKRLFINLGTKDGMTPRSLIDFVTGNTDLEPGLVSNVTVRELSSYFNVPNSAADFILQNLPQRKYQGRKVRVDEATPFDGGGGFRPQRGGYGGGGYEGNFRPRRFEGGPPQKKYGKHRS